MTERLRKSSYCPNCCKNVPHYRHVVTAAGQLINQFAGPLLIAMRLGPWFCLHCDRRQWWLRGPHGDAVDYQIPVVDEMSSAELTVASPQETTPSQSLDSVEIETVADVPIGNYIKSEKSLVMRSRRLLRFSEKYRDAIVQQLLNREFSMLEIKTKHDLTDAELVDWIADRFQRLEQQLDDLHLNSEPPILQIVAKSESRTAIPPR